MNYTIDFGTGVTQIVEGNLIDAKDAAVEAMSYTQEHVRILDENGSEVAVSYWYGVEAGEDDEVLAAFGSFGFYGDWQVGN